MTGLKKGITIKRNGENLTLHTKEGKQIGLICWHVFPGGKVLEIHNIFVEVEFQRKGYGTTLVQSLLDIYPDYVGVYLHSELTNTEANKFYMHLGFEEFGRISKFYGDGKDALFLMKKLKAYEQDEK